MMIEVDQGPGGNGCRDLVLQWRYRDAAQLRLLADGNLFPRPSRTTIFWSASRGGMRDEHAMYVHHVRFQRREGGVYSPFSGAEQS
jgi:hypothetical protein